MSKIVNPIKPKFEDKAETTTCTAITLNQIEHVPIENHMLMTLKRSKSKPEVEF